MKHVKSQLLKEDLMSRLLNKRAKTFLVADTQLYKRFCPLVCWSVGLLVRESKMIESKSRIVAKALDGQRYPLPLSECMWV